MEAFQTDEQGYLVGKIKLKLDPLETQKRNTPVYLVPSGATVTSPPKTGENEEARFINGSWVVVESRSEVKRKEDEGRLFVDGKWTDPRPSDDHVLQGREWVIPPEVAARLEAESQKQAALSAARGRLKDIDKANSVAEIKAMLKDVLTVIGVDP